MIGKWIYNFGCEENWNCCDDEFDTKQEAIKSGEIVAVENAHNKYQVGKVESVNLYIDADSVIEQLTEQACDECGESADGYLDDVSKEDIKELEKKLNEALNDWLTKTNNHPSFYKIVDVSDHKVNYELK